MRLQTGGRPGDRCEQPGRMTAAAHAARRTPKLQFMPLQAGALMFHWSQRHKEPDRASTLTPPAPQPHLYASLRRASQSASFFASRSSFHLLLVWEACDCTCKRRQREGLLACTVPDHWYDAVGPLVGEEQPGTC